MRRDPIEIIEHLFKVLERNRAFTINELAKESGIHNVTCKKYIRIIKMIREEPEIEVIRTNHSIVIRRKTVRY